MVSEGFLQWNVTPWKRRLATRGIAVVPCIVVAAAVGREGLSQVLNASQVSRFLLPRPSKSYKLGLQVALSIILPFVSAPLIYFTCKTSIMRVQDPSIPSSINEDETMVDLSNSWLVTVLGVVVWLFISGLNVVSRALVEILKWGKWLIFLSWGVVSCCIIRARAGLRRRGIVYVFKLERRQLALLSLLT